MRDLDWQMEGASDTVSSTLDAPALTAMARQVKLDFIQAMDDDFNAPRALGVIFDFIGSVNGMLDGRVLSRTDVPAVAQVRNIIVELMGVLGVDVEAALQEQGGEEYPEAVLALARQYAGFEGLDRKAAVAALLDARAAARAEKRWDVADGVRNGLAELGFIIEDTPQGARGELRGVGADGPLGGGSPGRRPRRLSSLVLLLGLRLFAAAESRRALRPGLPPRAPWGDLCFLLRARAVAGAGSFGEGCGAIPQQRPASTCAIGASEDKAT